MSNAPSPYDASITDPPDAGYDVQHWKAAPENWSPAEKAEYDQLQAVPQNLLLERAGKMGPALIGRPLHHLASQIKVSNPGGSLGPALLDPDHDAKQLAKQGYRRGEGGRLEPLDGSGARADDEDDAPPVDLEGPIDPKNLQDPRNPWTYVTLSGAKQLAMTGQVSYRPKVTRVELIADLQKAGVTPPPVPENTDDDDEVEA